VRVRGAATADVEAVAEIERTVFGPDAWTPAVVAEELTGHRRWARVVCEGDGRVVGYVVTATSGDVVDLHRIAVVPPLRRHGVARRLLAQARAAAAEAGAARMLLEVSSANEGALAFYVAHGFEEVHHRPRYYRDGSDALVLAVPLPELAGGGTG
jgi:[ribosomal protein S18]-alanine N-acetyltransferase